MCYSFKYGIKIYFRLLRQTESVLAQVISWLENKNTVDRNEVSAFLRQVSAVLKIKTSDVMKLMRSSLTGLKVFFFKYFSNEYI